MLHLQCHLTLKLLQRLHLLISCKVAKAKHAGRINLQRVNVCQDCAKDGQIQDVTKYIFHFYIFKMIESVRKPSENWHQEHLLWQIKNPADVICGHKGLIHENHQRRFGGPTRSSDVWEVSKLNPYSHKRHKKVLYTECVYKSRCHFCLMDKQSVLCCCILMYQETNNQSTPDSF